MAPAKAEASKLPSNPMLTTPERSQNKPAKAAKIRAELYTSGALVVASATSGAGKLISRASSNTARVGGELVADVVPNVPEGIPYFRVQGGGNGTATSRNALMVNADGTVSITPACSGAICVSAGSADHAIYYITNKRSDGSVVVFGIDRTTHNQIMEAAVPQQGNRGAGVKIVDKTTSGSATSLELDKIYSSLMSSGSSNGRVLTQQEFLNEFKPN